ncbi:MAG: hypothetical protein CL862_04980 [Cyanobium sp. NAT70]|nr:hypothetical protein [Cyanobium sp. NAT70]
MVEINLYFPGWGRQFWFPSAAGLLKGWNASASHHAFVCLIAGDWATVSEMQSALVQNRLS